MIGTTWMTDTAALTFRRLMGRFATGVAVVLTGGDEGPVGLTVNSLTSLSLDPPLLLFCARNESRAGRAVMQHGSFSINILSDAQQHISGYFAGHAERWTVDACARHGEWFTIPDCNAAIFCDVAGTYPGGDHTIVVGAVREIVGPATAKHPLLYHEGRYSAMRLHPLRACG
jgi:3-hydroxy-9,10-secoandrosta-1,3,5(10)-triene-9,17-dione monooxygenase reductase component